MYTITFDLNSFPRRTTWVEEFKKVETFFQDYNIQLLQILHETCLMTCACDEDLVKKWEDPKFQLECQNIGIIGIEAMPKMEAIATPDVCGQNFGPSGIANL